MRFGERKEKLWSWSVLSKLKLHLSQWEQRIIWNLCIELEETLNCLRFSFFETSNSSCFSIKDPGITLYFQNCHNSHSRKTLKMIILKTFTKHVYFYLFFFLLYCFLVYDYCLSPQIGLDNTLFEIVKCTLRGLLPESLYLSNLSPWYDILFEFFFLSLYFMLIFVVFFVSSFRAWRRIKKESFIQPWFHIWCVFIIT
jgi:hypothetical protein